MILTREVIEAEWNVIVQSAELCTLGVITRISAWSLGLITWKRQNRREREKAVSTPLSQGMDGELPAWSSSGKAYPSFSHWEWVRVRTVSLPRCEHSQELCRPLLPGKGSGRGWVCLLREREAWLVQEEQTMAKRDLSAMREGGINREEEGNCLS